MASRAIAVTRLRVSLVCAVGMLLAACAGPVGHMREVPADQWMAQPEPDKAVVVFMRPSGLGFAIASSVYELGADGDRFIGIVPAKRKLSYSARPGRTRFMVVSEAADFMEAELEAGKRYHVLVTPRVGVWKARFSLKPVTSAELASEEFAGWLKDCTPIENSDASRAWAHEHWADIQNKKVEYLQKWEPRTDRPALRAEDGR
jgi:hypothetical protein